MLDKVYLLSACNIFYHNNRRNSTIPAFMTATLEKLKCVIMSSRLKAQGSNTIVLVVEEIILLRGCLCNRVRFCCNLISVVLFSVIIFGSFLSNQIWIFEQICSAGSSAKCEWMDRRSCHICGLTLTHIWVLVVLNLFDTTDNAAPHFWV